MNQGFKQTLLVTMAMAMAAGAVAQVKIDHPGDVVIGDLTNASQSASASNLFRFPDAFDLRGLALDATTPADGFKWSFFEPTGGITINGISGINPGADDPVNPPLNRRIDQNDLDKNTVDGFDGNPYTVTFRNTNLSPFGGPYQDPPTAGILPAETRTVTLIAANATTYGIRSIMVYSSNNTSDRLIPDGGDPADPNAPVPPIIDDDLSLGSNSGRWTGGVSQGQASFEANSSGLCLTAPQTGDNEAAWLSPERFITLVDNAVYRVRLTVTGSQTDVNAIPLWTLGYNNFSSGGGGNYGGDAWFLDVDGGANGVGRNGLSNFEMWITPNAVGTKQWRGIVDSNDSAFGSAQADANNDMRLLFRVLDIGKANIEANSDSGDLCMKSIAVTRFSLSQLQVASTVFSDVISTGTYFAQGFGQEAGGTASIDNTAHTANYQLAEGPTAATAARKSLGPWDQSPGSADIFAYSRLYPVAWKADTLYRGRIKIKSNTGGAEGTNPVEVIALAFDTPNSELGQMHYSTAGSAGNMHLAASPRLETTTGGGQWYTGFFYGQAGTVSVVPDTGRMRLFGDFFSTADIVGSGNDPFTVEAMDVAEITKPN